MIKTDNHTPDSALEQLLSECFSGGELRRRELRLSETQAYRVTQFYPASQVRPLGGSWYEITFQGAYRYGS